ncbi:MAG TPA: ABC transporter permease [Caulobacteraceae bacterium]|nr:ABC transporter permease [Caulobacteraceae bacterium]
MSIDASRWRPAPLLPRRLPGRLWLGLTIAILTFMAALAAIGAQASLRAARGWAGELAGSASVLVRASGLESPDAAAARAAEALAGVPGVAEARALSASEADALLSRFIDPKDLPPGVWTPRLVTVAFNPDRPARIADLRAALAAEGINAVVEDHAVWTNEVRRTGEGALAAALTLAALMIAAVAALSAFAARQGLEAAAGLVGALRLSGAADGFVAGLFAGRFAGLAAAAAVVGALAALVAAAAFVGLGPDETFAAILPVRWSDLALAAPAPVLAVGAAALAAGLAARRGLSRLP